MNFKPPCKNIVFLHLHFNIKILFMRCFKNVCVLLPMQRFLMLYLVSQQGSSFMVFVFKAHVHVSHKEEREDTDESTAVASGTGTDLCTKIAMGGWMDGEVLVLWLSLYNEMQDSRI